MAYEMVYGPTPPGVCVLHKCDTPACVNPNHLRLGTHADNMADKVRRGRQARGERHTRAKLTRNDVDAIRWAVSMGVSHRRLAEAYRLSSGAIASAVYRWRHP